MTAPSEIYLHGEIVQLGKFIASGGEGEVFFYGDKQAIKIYWPKDRTKEREAKIVAMIAANLAEKSSLIAFPHAIVRDRVGGFVGFVMQLVKGHTSLHDLYAPGSRKIHFPKADYRFTIRAATNIARAVAKVHELGAVIGDINHSGMLISNEAVAALIDADSFQFGTDHLCRVGVAEYTPPELQAQRLDGIVRAPNHDGFGLAVVIFQLLFMGRHPFMGRYARGEMPVEKAISEHRFAYSKVRDTGMTPPPGACQLEDFPIFIGAAFEAAFAQNSTTRPTALQWVRTLEALEGALSKCGTNAIHFYPSAAGKCVWCRMEQQIGILLFLPSFDLGERPNVSDPGAAGFNLAAVWAAIERVNIPDPVNLNPPLSAPTVEASDEAKALKSERTSQRAIGFVSIAAAVGILLWLPALWIIYVPTAWFGVTRAFATDTGNSGKFTSRFREVEIAMLDAIDSWRGRIGVVEMQSLYASLADAKERLQNLPADELRRISEHEATRRDSQLHNYLEMFPIWRAKIRGIGPAKIAALSSYGIDTAADVVFGRIVANVPGFGEVNVQPLLDWRRKLESRFVFRAQPSPSEIQEVQRIRQSCSAQAVQFRVALLTGTTDLQRASATMQLRVKVLDPAISRANRDREQARADLKFLGVPEPNVVARVAPTTAVRTSQYAPPRHRPPILGQSASIPASTLCPTCGGRMVKRLARRGRNAGGYFWGCAAYPRCNGTRSV